MFGFSRIFKHVRSTYTHAQPHSIFPTQFHCFSLLAASKNIKKGIEHTHPRKIHGSNDVIVKVAMFLLLSSRLSPDGELKGGGKGETGGTYFRGALAKILAHPGLDAG